MATQLLKDVTETNIADTLDFLVTTAADVYKLPKNIIPTKQYVDKTFATKVSVDTEVNKKANLSGGNTFSGNQNFIGNISFGGNISLDTKKITGIAAPTENSDATNKKYVDDQDAEKASLSENNTFTGNNTFTQKQEIQNSLIAGHNCVASGNYSVALNEQTKATANYSHAEGKYTTASGESSHAEGAGAGSLQRSEARGSYSHVEGYCTKTYEGSLSGNAAHAEGYNTIAKYVASHAEGYHTVTGNSYQHVAGQYNYETANSARITGWGSLSQQKNIEQLTTSGDLRLAGDVYTGCTARSSGGDKLATEEYINNALSTKANLTGGNAFYGQQEIYGPLVAYGGINAGTYPITNLEMNANPNDNDAVNKHYVDTVTPHIYTITKSVEQLADISVSGPGSIMSNSNALLIVTAMSPDVTDTYVSSQSSNVTVFRCASHVYTAPDKEFWSDIYCLFNASGNVTIQFGSEQ